jgi:hypothetical protein
VLRLPGPMLPLLGSSIVPSYVEMLYRDETCKREIKN